MGENMILQVGVKALIKNKDGKYLLLRRSEEKYPEVSGRWDIVGGRIDPGKTLIENLRREIFEETKMELIGEPKLIAAQDILKNPGRHVVRLTYSGEARGEVVLDKEENDTFRWYSLEELRAETDLDDYLKELLAEDKLLPKNI